LTREQKNNHHDEAEQLVKSFHRFGRGLVIYVLKRARPGSLPEFQAHDYKDGPQLSQTFSGH
jgi:hypothetical protein